MRNERDPHRASHDADEFDARPGERSSITSPARSAGVMSALVGDIGAFTYSFGRDKMSEAGGEDVSWKQMLGRRPGHSRAFVR